MKVRLKPLYIEVGGILFVGNEGEPCPYCKEGKLSQTYSGDFGGMRCDKFCDMGYKR